MKLTLSAKIFFGLVVLLSILGALNVFLPQGNLIPGSYPASKPVMALASFFIILIIYGILGFIGFILSSKIGFPEILDKKISNRQRFFIPAIVGVALGILLIVVDTLVSKFNPLGPLPHPPFPTSIFASAAAGIGEELLFRLFFISFWVWLISYIILKKKFQNQVFWIVAFASAIVFAAGHFPSLMILYSLQNINQIPPILIGEIFLLNVVISIAAAYYFRKYGYVAAIGVHFWTDIVWHVIWGSFLIQLIT